MGKETRSSKQIYVRVCARARVWEYLKNGWVLLKSSVRTWLSVSNDFRAKKTPPSEKT